MPDQPAALHHADTIAQRQRLRHVVRHEDHALGDTRLDADELLLQLAARDRIERAERLIHEQHRRIGGQRAGHADALPLSAGELVGPAMRVGVGRHADQLEQLAHASRDAIVRPLLEPRHDGDVVADREVREEADLLNHVADRSPKADRIPLARVPTLHDHVTGVGQEQSIDQLEERRLARAARPDERQRLPRSYRQRDVVENARLPRQAVRDVAELDAVHDTTIERVRLAAEVRSARPSWRAHTKV